MRLFAVVAVLCFFIACSGKGCSGEVDVASGSPPVAASDGTVQCGTVTCSGNQAPIIGVFPACCPRGPDVAACGLDLAPLIAYSPTTSMLSSTCIERDQAGELDPSCPDQVLPSSEVRDAVLPGCCRKVDGKCGYMLRRSQNLPAGMEFDFGLGCVNFRAMTPGGPPEVDCNPARSASLQSP